MLCKSFLSFLFELVVGVPSNSKAPFLIALRFDFLTLAEGLDEVVIGEKPKSLYSFSRFSIFNSVASLFFSL